jgi:Rrf2 family protein
MQLSTASRFAIRGLVHLAKNLEEIIPARRIAEAQGVPERFLVRAFAPMVVAGILEIPAGPAGGYRLARPAGEVSLLEVVELVEGLSAAPAPQGAVCPEGAHGFPPPAARAEHLRQLARVRIADLANGHVYGPSP